MAARNVKKEDKSLIQARNDIKRLEEFYVNGTVNDIIPVLNAKKTELVDKMVEYAKENEHAVKWDKDGVPIDYAVDIKPVVINNYFFKSIVPYGACVPLYNAEKLWMVYDYYMELIAEVNDKIGDFPPTLTGFCKLAGLTLNNLKEYKSSSDLDLRTVAEKIYDEIGDNNLTMSQIGKTRERSTLFRLKSQNEIVEKAQPNVNITFKEVVNTDKINANLEKYKSLLDKKVK